MTKGEAIANMSPDTTFETINVKRVPYKELDYNIYKSSNLVAYQNSEKRLPLWIETVYRYFANSNNTNGGFSVTEHSTRNHIICGIFIAMVLR